MRFSIIIPSRNRAALLRQAIESVLAQTWPEFEVIVVNDGSVGEELAGYRAMHAEWPDRVRFVDLENSPRGHGPSYAINRGVERAAGDYVCFLDDDDQWTDPQHLERAAASLERHDGDLYLTNQEAWSRAGKVEGSLWINRLAEYLRDRSTPDDLGTVAVGVADLVRGCDGSFAHLNTMIARRTLYLAVSGMDEQIRYEGDWDLYLRLIGEAKTILHNPAVVARHNVPDPMRSDNESTSLSQLQRLLSRALVLDKAVLFSSADLVREMAMRHKAFTLKKIAQLLAADKRYGQALFYARQARTRMWDIKWRLYTLVIAARAAVAG